ncbi:MAG: sugar ABC transporter permease [Chloroflexi bacterium]|nr:sugar ABC transporter permease [Chloroflexota bacterium]
MLHISGRIVTARPRADVLAKIVGAETRLQVKDALQGYLFLLPWILGLLLFVAGPLLASLYLGFTNYSVLGSPSWVGLENYETAFLKDDLFWPSLARTLYYACGLVPLSLLGSLLLATLLNQGIYGQNTFRTMFFLPHLTPAIAMAVLWSWLLHPSLGPINAALGSVGLPQPLWLRSRESVIPTLILISTWGSVGGNNMLIFLAALQDVPAELYEAAQIDGAGPFHKFWYITLPMISPAFLFNLVLGIVGALKVFSMAYVATQGGPNYGSWFFALHIYYQSFSYFRLGYGSSLAWIFASALIMLTILTLKLSGRWVYYAGSR